MFKKRPKRGSRANAADRAAEDAALSEGEGNGKQKKAKHNGGLVPDSISAPRP